MEKKDLRFAEHDDSRVRCLRRVETLLVDDRSFVWDGLPIDSADKLARAFDRLKEQAREQGVVLFLDHSNIPIGFDLWLGSIDFVTIDPRRILVLAGQLLASKIAICHNHPQGRVALPSDGDVMFCMQMGQLCRIMSWEFFDFMVLCPNGWYSFREAKHPALGQEVVPVRIIQ